MLEKRDSRGERISVLYTQLLSTLVDRVQAENAPKLTSLPTLQVHTMWAVEDRSDFPNDSRERPTSFLRLGDSVKNEEGVEGVWKDPQIPCMMHKPGTVEAEPHRAHHHVAAEAGLQTRCTEGTPSPMLEAARGRPGAGEPPSRRFLQALDVAIGCGV